MLFVNIYRGSRTGSMPTSDLLLTFYYPSQTVWEFNLNELKISSNYYLECYTTLKLLCWCQFTRCYVQWTPWGETTPLLTLFVPSNSEWVTSPSPSNTGAKRSKIEVGQEKTNKDAYILMVNIAVLPSLSDTLLLSSSQFVQNEAPIYHLSHQLRVCCHHQWKVSIQCFRKLIFLWLAIIFFANLNVKTMQ